MVGKQLDTNTVNHSRMFIVEQYTPSTIMVDEHHTHGGYIILSGRCCNIERNIITLTGFNLRIEAGGANRYKVIDVTVEIRAFEVNDDFLTEANRLLEKKDQF
jgi:hypothetical protein